MASRHETAERRTLLEGLYENVAKHLYDTGAQAMLQGLKRDHLYLLETIHTGDELAAEIRRHIGEPIEQEGAVVVPLRKERTR